MFPGLLARRAKRGRCSPRCIGSVARKLIALSTWPPSLQPQFTAVVVSIRISSGITSCRSSRGRFLRSSINMALFASSDSKEGGIQSAFEHFDDGVTRDGYNQVEAKYMGTAADQREMHRLGRIQQLRV